MEIAKANAEKTLFFHTPQASGLPRYTVAGYIKDNTLYLGIARCGKKDSFKRSIGRQIAEGRLFAGIKDPEKRSLKRRFCEVPFATEPGTKGFGKEFVDQAVFTIQTIDTKWAKVNMKDVKRSKKNKTATLVVV
jgi:hypothetical protein